MMSAHSTRGQGLYCDAGRDPRLWASADVDEEAEHVRSWR